MTQRGFTLIEVLFASAILLSFITVFIPMVSDVHLGQQRLIDKRNIVQSLHEELQPFLWDDGNNLPVSYQETLENKTVNFQFITENEFVKGCAEWIDKKDKNETICLYGIPKQ